MFGHAHLQHSARQNGSVRRRTGNGSARGVNDPRPCAGFPCPLDDTVKRSRARWLAMANSYLDHCFRMSSVPRVDEMARLIGMSREGFTRAFRASTGHSPADTFRSMQLHRAKELLLTSECSTEEIAKATAFGSARAFYRAFLRCVEMTPTEYRRQARTR